MKKKSFLGTSTVGVLMVVLAVGTLAWAFAMLPPDHQRQRALVRCAAYITFAALFVAALAHGRAARAGDTLQRWVSLLTFVPAGVVLVIAYIVLSTHSHRVPRNEAYLISDMRALLSAQAIYAASNEGHADGDLQCLVQPTRCLRSYPSSAPYFLDAELASLAERRGFRRSFHPGPPPEEVPPAAPPPA